MNAPPRPDGGFNTVLATSCTPFAVFRSIVLAITSFASGTFSVLSVIKACMTTSVSASFVRLR